MRELTRQEKMSLVRDYAESLGLRSSFTKHGDLTIKANYYEENFRYHDCYDIYEREDNRLYEDEIKIILKRNFG